MGAARYTAMNNGYVSDAGSEVYIVFDNVAGSEVRSSSGNVWTTTSETLANATADMRNRSYAAEVARAIMHDKLAVALAVLWRSFGPYQAIMNPDGTYELRGGGDASLTVLNEQTARYALDLLNGSD